MEQKLLEENVQAFLEKRSLYLSELKWLQEGRGRILQLSIMYENGSMDLETCSQVSTDISPHLEEWLINVSNYTLEVCSPGAERELHSAKEVEAVVNQHVKILFKHPLEKSLDWTGKLIEFDQEKGKIEVRIKSRHKTIEFEYSNVVKIRLAVVL